MQRTSNGDKEAEAARATRAGSARPDFLSNLGRRIGELRTCLKGLEQEPGSPRLRDDMRRRVHALSAGARHLRFTAMATALAEAERLLERAAAAGGVDPAELTVIGGMLDELPALAWSEPSQEYRPTERPLAPAEAGARKRGVPPSVLIVGPSGLADAIANPLEHGLEEEIECERTESASAALEMARALAPDVAVVDVDLPGAKDLLSKLTRDPLTEPLPVVVVGTWGAVEEGARWVAAGASRALAKPISPHALRKACIELSRGNAPPVQYAPMGHATVEDLTARIVAEVKRGLEDAVVVGKSTSVALGDGSDIIAAVWGALARVRDLVSIKSGGLVRFSGQGPEGALPIAPWWGDASVSDEPPVSQGEARREEQGPLEGRRVVVADDDPAVTWFIGGVLRSAGAVVREAHDGNRALEVCFRFTPEVVISDVLMPGLDGFALCRALKRDIALRDVPVILLSWKEDLLQRLRDLGADADGYLRKEASATAILGRVLEVLRERARLEARLKSEGEVRGRLDGVTPRTLLEVTAKLRPNARVRIRDASFLYEMELRGGSPRSASRTTSDGSFQRGRQVFAALLGVRSGRFVVSRTEGGARGTLEGDLESQMQGPVVEARAALSLLGGTRLLDVHRVDVAVDQVEPYLSATPEPARSLIVRLSGGASPRDLVLTGEIASAQLEGVLTDLAIHGAIIGIRGAGDSDLLGPALEREFAATRNGMSPSMQPESAPKSATVEPWSSRTLRSPAPAPVAVGEYVGGKLTLPGERSSAAAVEVAQHKTAASSPEFLVEAQLIDDAPPAAELDVEPVPARFRSRPPPPDPSPETENASQDYEEEAPSSLEAAVIRQISDPTPSLGTGPRSGAGGLRGASPGAGSTEGDRSIIDMSELRARILAAPPASEPPGEPSLPPDAIIPGSGSDERIQAAEVTSSAGGTEMDPAQVSHDSPPPRYVGSREAPSGASVQDHGADPDDTDPDDTDLDDADLDDADLDDADAQTRGLSEDKISISTPPEPKRSASVGLAALVALGTIALLVAALRYGRAPSNSEPAASPSPGTVAPVVSSVPPSSPSPNTGKAAVDTPGGTAKVEVVPGRAETQAPKAQASAVLAAGEDAPLPRGVAVGPNQGLLEIETGDRAAVFVDGVDLGRGPFVRLALTPGVHEVRLRGTPEVRAPAEVRGSSEDRVRLVTIRAARRTRLLVSSTWTR